MVVDTRTLEKWRTEYGEKGHEREMKVMAILTSRLEITEVGRNKVGEKLSYSAVSRSTPEEDFNEGFDLHFYSRGLDKWFKIDISTSSDPEVHEKKRIKEREEGVVFVPLRGADIDQGYLGGERGIRKVEESFVSSIKAYLGTESPKATTQPEASPLPA